MKEKGRGARTRRSPEGKRILLLATYLPPDHVGGAELTTLGVAIALAKAGHDVTCLTFTRGPSRVEDVKGVRVVRTRSRLLAALSRGGSLRFLKYALHALDMTGIPRRRMITRHVLGGRYEMLILHNQTGWGLSPYRVAKRRDLPLISVFHDYGGICVRKTEYVNGVNCENPCQLCRVRAKRTAAAIKAVGASRPNVLFVSSALRNRYMRRPEWADVVHEAQIGYPMNRPEISARRSGQVKTTGPVCVGYLGQLSKVKGVEGLLTAVRGLPITLLIAGAGEEKFEEHLRAIASSNTKLLGMCDSKDFLSRVDILVIPSEWNEPFGRVVVEGAAAGCWLLLADRPGLVEAADWSGCVYETFPAGDMDALRASLMRMVDSMSGMADETSDRLQIEPLTQDHGASMTLVARELKLVETALQCGVTPVSTSQRSEVDE